MKFLFMNLKNSCWALKATAILLQWSTTASSSLEGYSTNISLSKFKHLLLHQAMLILFSNLILVFLLLYFTRYHFLKRVVYKWMDMIFPFLLFSSHFIRTSKVAHADCTASVAIKYPRTIIYILHILLWKKIFKLTNDFENWPSLIKLLWKCI